ncbi:MAG: hypothetical protein AB1750_02585 [Chloroflexota bacterium]
MLPLLHKFRASEKSIPLVLFGVTLLSYGLFTNQQGFHWDDWGFTWMAHFGGPGRLYNYFQGTRPFLAYNYMLTMPLLGSSPLVWQIFALIGRAVHAIALWWALKQIFVSRKPVIATPSVIASEAKQSPPGAEIASTDVHRLAMTSGEIFWASLLVLVYPGFSQHSVAIAFGHYSYLFAFFWLSLGLMIVSWRAPRGWWKWTSATLALFLSCWQLLSSEYYFGLEVLRPLFLWIALAEPGDTLKSRLKRTAWIYLPYFIILLFFLYWRVFIFGFHMYQAELFESNQPATSLVFTQIPSAILQAIATSAGQAWLTILDFAAVAQFSTRLLLVYVFIILGSFLFLVFYNNRFDEEGTQALPRTYTGKQVHTYTSTHGTRNTPIAGIRKLITDHCLLITGLLSLLTAGLPFYITNLPIVLGAPEDRFIIPFAFGAACLLVGLAGLLRKLEHRALLLSLVVALSMGKQIQYADSFRQDWERAQSFFWQLTWRAPGLEPGTVLLSDDSAILNSVDYSLGAPINWTYFPDNPGARGQIVYYFISTRLHYQLPDLKPGLPIEQNMYPGKFRSSTDNLLVLQYRPPACLHILDPLYYSDLPAPPNSADITADMLADGLPLLTARTLQALPLSNVSRIIPDADPGATPPSVIFGTEPAHGWCYYFQKADLARQQRDWSRVAALGDEAFAIPLYPNDASEFLPFIEAYLRLGRLNDARDWTRNAYKQAPILAPALCGVWRRVQAENATPNPFIDKVIAELPACPTPP